MKLIYVHNADFSSFSANKIQVTNMCNAFSQANEDVTLLSFATEGLGKMFHFKEKVKKVFLKSSRSYYFRTLQLFWKFSKLKFDYVYSRDLVFTYLVKLLYPKKQILYELHDLPQSIVWKTLFKLTFKKLDKLIVISEGLKEELVRRGFEENKIVVLHDGVDLEKFDIKLSSEEARVRLNLPTDKKIISYVGSTEKIRDLDTFIEVSKEFPDILFLVYGTKRDYLIQYDEELKNFKYGGMTTMPEVVYKASDVLFAGYTDKIKTINYMSPLKIFEYMASKRPFIISDFPRVKEVLSEKDVFFYESQDSSSLIKAVRKAMVNNIHTKTKVMNSFVLIKSRTWLIRVNEIIKYLKERVCETN